MQFDAYEIQKYQQNRYPAFFVDKITDLFPGKYANGIKNFSFNEWFSQNRTDTSVPSVIIGEAMEQTYLMTFLSLPEYKGAKTSTVSAAVEFFRNVKYGASMKTEAKLLINSRGLTRGTVTATVCGEIVAKADFTVVIPSITEKFKPKKGEAK